MATMTARVYDMTVVPYGANVFGDHVASSTTLSLQYGWDFPVDGGQVRLSDDSVLTYTSAEYPDPELEDDDLPTVLTLDGTLGVDLLDGDFAALEPRQERAVALVEVAGSGQGLSVQVKQELIPSLAEGIRGTEAEAPTVILDDAGTGTFEVVSIQGEPPAIDGSRLSHEVELPPQIIPEEGIMQYAQAFVEQLIFDQLQGRIAVMDELYVVRRDEADPSQPDPDSSVIRLSSLEGMVVEVPTGVDDGEGNHLYDLAMTVPTYAFDEAGNRIVAQFFGKITTSEPIDAASINLLSQTERSHVGSGHTMQIDNVVANPNTAPTVSFGPKTRAWRYTSDGVRELGWGVNGGNVVQGRVATDSNGVMSVRAQQIDPNNAAAGATVDLVGFWRNVGGICVGNGRMYVLGQVTNSVPWTVVGFNLSDGAVANAGGSPVQTQPIVQDGPAGRMALTYDSGNVVLTWRRDSGEISTQSWGPNLGGSGTVVNTGITNSGRVVGTVGEYTLIGNTAISSSGSSRSFSTRMGTPTAFGALPSGQLAATNGSGTLYLFNTDKPTDTSVLYAAFTKRQTTTSQQTLMSPVRSLSWPARMFATIQAPTPQGGPNDVGLYASSTSSARTAMWSVSKPNGQFQQTISSAPTSGSNPPATSGFASGSSPGRIVSEAGGSDPYTDIRGDGSVTMLKFRQEGRVTVTVAAIDTDYTRSITFGVPFDSVPNVQLTAQNIQNPKSVDLSANNVTTTGFNIRYSRSAFPGSDIQIGWSAGPATQ